MGAMRFLCLVVPLALTAGTSLAESTPPAAQATDAPLGASAPAEATPAPTPAVEATPAPAPAPAEGTPAPAATRSPPVWFVHLNVGLPVFTSVGPWTTPTGNAVPAQSFTPAQRFGLVQLLGVGRWLTPWFRLNLSIQFAELLTGQPVAMPAGAHTFTGLAFVGAVVWGAFMYGPFFAGLGPMVGPRWMGNSASSWVYFDAGLFTCAGASLKLGAGFLLALAVQVPVTFNPAVIVSVVPALSVARRF